MNFLFCATGQKKLITKLKIFPFKYYISPTLFGVSYVGESVRNLIRLKLTPVWVRRL